MNGGGGTTSTIQKSDPWAGAQPYLTDLMSKAQQTYDASQGQTYSPPTYAGPSDVTQQALQSIVARAQAGSPLIGAANQSLTNILQPQTAPGSDALKSLLSGYSDPGNALTQAGATAVNPALGTALSLAAGGGPGAGTMAQWADTNNVNPYLDQMFSSASKPVIDAVNARAGLAGRTGSGADQQLLTRDLGDLAANIYGSGYENAANRSLSAANSLQNSALSGTSLLSNIGQQQAANLLSGGGQLSANAANQANVVGNAANALNSLFNTQNQQALTAATVAPSLAGQDYTDLQNMLTAGGAYDTQSQNQLNSILSQWQYAQQQPWNILSGYAGAISGLGGLGGTSSGSTTQPSQSAIPGLIGTGISALPFLMGL